MAVIFGGIPEAGATIRTVVNINSGGKTRLSGMIAAVMLLIIVVALGGFVENIPSAVLAGILIAVGICVMDYKGLKVLSSIPKSDIVMMFVVMLLTVFWDLVYAVGIRLVMTSLIFMKKMGDVNNDESGIKRLSDSKHMNHADYSRIPVKFREEVFIKELSSPIFFGYTTDFQSMSRDIPPYATHAMIRMKKVPFIDQSGLFAFEDVLQNLLQKGIQPLLIEVQEQPLYSLETIDIMRDLIGKEHVFENYDACLKWIIKNVEDTVPALEG